MKKKRPSLFPGEEKLESIADEPSLNGKSLAIGHKLRIAKPSGPYYQYLYGSLSFEKHSLKDLKSMLSLEGNLYQIMAMLTMKDKDVIGVAVNVDSKSHRKDLNKIYISLDKALKAKEIRIQNETIKIKKNDNN